MKIKKKKKKGVSRPLTGGVHFQIYMLYLVPHVNNQRGFSESGGAGLGWVAVFSYLLSDSCRQYLNLWRSSFSGHIHGLLALPLEQVMKSIPKACTTNKSSAWHIERHIWTFEIGVKCQVALSHTAMCTAPPPPGCELRYFLWVWSRCPTTTGSTRWTPGCAMGWASYPWRPRPCCGRRGSCQRPRAAATAQHQTGAQGSSHRAPCAGVCVYVRVCVCVSCNDHLLYCLLSIRLPVAWDTSYRWGWFCSGYFWVNVSFVNWSTSQIKAAVTGFVLASFPAGWLCDCHVSAITCTFCVHASSIFFSLKETISPIKKKQQSRTDTCVIMKTRQRIFSRFSSLSAGLIYIIVALF